jgi:hypothetical protein
VRAFRQVAQEGERPEQLGTPLVGDDDDGDARVRPGGDVLGELRAGRGEVASLRTSAQTPAGTGRRRRSAMGTSGSARNSPRNPGRPARTVSRSSRGSAPAG